MGRSAGKDAIGMSWKIYSSSHPRYTTYVVGLLTVLAVLNTLDRMVISILVQPIKEELGLSDTDLGLVMGLGFSLMYATCAFPLARMADRGNRRNILGAILALWSLATAMCGLAQTALQLIVCRMVMAGAESGQMPVAQSLVADYVTPQRRARAIGWLGAGTTVGGLLGLVLGGWLGQEFGWRWAFVAVGLPGVLIAGVVFLTLREPRDLFAGTQRATDDEVQPLGATIRLLISRRSFVMLTLAATFCTIPAYSANMWNAALMMRRFGVSVGQAGLFLGLVAGTAATAGMLLGGYLGERGKSGPKGLIGPMWAMLLAGPVFTMAYVAPSFHWSIALLIFPSIAGGVWYPPIYAALQNSVPARTRAIAVAVMMFVTSTMGLGLGPTMVGVLSDLMEPVFGTDSLRMAVIGMANLTVVGALFLLLSKRALEQEAAGQAALA